MQAFERSRAQKPRDKTLIATQENQVYNAMLRVSEVHPDPQFRIEYRIRAEEFKSGDEKAKRSVLKKIGMGIGAVVLSPVIITGASLLLAGGIVLGTGRALAGAGHAMTGGKLMKYGWMPGGKKAKVRLLLNLFLIRVSSSPYL